MKKKINRRNLLKTGLIVSGAALLGNPACQFTLAAAKKKPALTLWQLPNKTRSQMMSYILKTANGKVIVIDGGTRGDAPYLEEQIRNISGGTGQVDLWIMTHIHSDHVHALAQLLDNKTDLKIDRVTFDFPDLDWIEKYENTSVPYAQYTFKQFKKLSCIDPMTPNKPILFGDVQINQLNDRDPLITHNAINNSGLVFRFQTPKTSILFLGDLGVEAGDRVVKLQKQELLRADVVQMAHHGQQGVRKEFYDYVRPKICLWPTPDWLWDNNSGKGPGSGPWKTVQNRAWMDDQGVKVHYVSKDGLKKLDFE